jgi:hypothetical protein
VTMLLYWRNTTSCERTCSAVPIHHAAQRPRQQRDQTRDALQKRFRAPGIEKVREKEKHPTQCCFDRFWLANAHRRRMATGPLGRGRVKEAHHLASCSARVASQRLSLRSV